MAKKTNASNASNRRDPVKKRTSIGNSTRSRPTNKHSTFKRTRGQGRP